VAERSANATGRQRFGLLVSSTLLVATGAVSYFAVRGANPPLPRADEAATATTLAVGEVEIPPGPHREVFQAQCVICHSAVLPLGQPVLTHKQWTEVVHKMASAYGAPITPGDEAHIVEYMTAIQAGH
jgi:hypothetical protein